jgi:hypothetical protein
MNETSPSKAVSIVTLKIKIQLKQTKRKNAKQNTKQNTKEKYIHLNNQINKRENIKKVTHFQI